MKSCLLSQKKERMRKQIKTEYLNRYMKNIREEMIESHQYITLRNIINLFDRISPHQEKKSLQQLNCLQKLVQLLNKGFSPAGIELSNLLLQKKIGVKQLFNCFFKSLPRNSQQFEYYQSSSLQNSQNYQNSNSISKDKTDKPITQFPQYSTNVMTLKPPQQENQGWLVLIRSLLLFNYFTQEMVYYCLNIIMYHKSNFSLDLALQIVYSLLNQKQIVSIQSLMKLILSSNKNSQQLVQQSKIKGQPLPTGNITEKKTENQTFKRVNQFFSSLWRASLNTNGEDQRDIQFFSTKLLLACFQSSNLMQEIYLKVISLRETSQYLLQKFSINSKGPWHKQKSLKLMSNLLICLSEHKHFQLTQIVQKIKNTLKIMIDELAKVSYDLRLSNNSEKGFLFHIKIKDYVKNYDQNFKYLEEGLFLLQVVVEDYLSFHNNIDITYHFLMQFPIDITLIYLHEGYASMVENIKRKYEQDEFSFEDMCRILLVEKVERLTESLVSQLIGLQKKILCGDIQCDSKKLEMLLLSKKVIFKRLKQSSLNSKFNQTLSENNATEVQQIQI